MKLFFNILTPRLPLDSDDVAYNGLYGVLPRQYLAPERRERVQVLRGASAFLNGAAPGGSGIGGAINLMPKRQGETGIQHEDHAVGMFSVRLDYRGRGYRLSADTGYQNVDLTSPRPSVGIGGVAVLPSAPDAAKNAYAIGDAFASNIYAPENIAAPATAYMGGIMSDPRITQKTTLSSYALADTMDFLDDKLRLTVGLRRQQVKDAVHECACWAA